MTYFQGFIIPVRPGRKEAYRQMAIDAAPIFHDYGATRIVETWGVEVPDGKQTDMKRAVAAEAGEDIVFSWIEWPDRATCEAAGEKMQNDERMKPPPEMPFDPKRMIHAGFEPVFEQGGGGFGYVDGMVAAVPKTGREAYAAFGARINPLFLQHGAIRAVDTWAEDIADGKVTDFKQAVAARDDEAVVFGWIEWPDRATRDKAWEALQAEPAMQGNAMPFDGGRMIFGGFEVLVDTIDG